jgi:hypothetical protein
MKSERKCCFLENNTVPCSVDAEWEIHDGSPFETVDACTKHVGDLLSDAPEHRIYPLRTAPVSSPAT